MSAPLFRPEAVLASMGSRFGKAVFYQPFPLRLFVMGTVLAFTAFLAFASWAQVKETRPVRGIVTTTAGEIKIDSERPGVFEEVRVEEGQNVTAGEVLAILHDPRFTAAGERAVRTMTGHMNRQKDQLGEQIRLSQARANLIQAQLQSRVATLQRELALLQEELALTGRRLHLAERDQKAIQSLHESGSIATAEYNRNLASLYAMQQVSVSNQLKIESTQQKLQEIHQQLRLHPITAKDELLSLQNALEQLHARDTELTNGSRFALIAPISGKVSNLLARAGDSTVPRVPVMTLLPTDSQLHAELYLPSNAMGLVEAGQEIMLHYDAYPFETYGSFAATIRSVSQTTIDPREILIPLPLQEPVYRLLGALDDHSNTVNLRPGMQFSAEIITGRRSILDRLLQPLHSLGRRL